MDNSSFPIIAQNVCQNKYMIAGLVFCTDIIIWIIPHLRRIDHGLEMCLGADCMFCHTASQFPIYQKKNQTLEHIPSMKTTFACSISEIVCFLHICPHTSSISLLRIQLGTSFL